MKTINLVIEFDYDHTDEEIKEFLEGPFSLYAYKEGLEFGNAKVLSFGEVVGLLAEEKKRIYNEGFADGKKRKKK